MSAGTPRFRLPLVRALSRPVTPWLAATGASANAVTSVSLLVGLAAAAALLAPAPALLAAVLLLACYVLDNCDGEIARLRGEASRFGMHYDTFVDWLVHGAFFAALGHREALASGDAWWAWLGWAAAAGATVNYVVGLALDRADPDAVAAREAAGARPRSAGEWLLFAFRELARADFCFIVLALAAFDALWLLLPAAAAGAQAYWMTRFVHAARRFRV